MSSKQNLVIGVLGVLAVVGGIVISSIIGQISLLTSTQTELQSKFDHLEAKNEALAGQISDLTKANVAQVEDLKASVAKLSEPPSSDELAASIVSQSGDDLASAIAEALADDPKFAAVLKGKDADPAAVAASLMSLPTMIMFVDRVGGWMWASHRQDLAADPELIATIANTVYNTYGTELAGTMSAKKQAAFIADELAKQPAFAAMVAAARPK